MRCCFAFYHRNLDGIFLVASQEIFGGNLFLNMAFGQKSIIGSSEFIRILRIYGIMAG